jgi:hypothetical protein
MKFEQATEDFRQFLRKQGHVRPLVWIASTEVAFWRGELLVRPTKGRRSELNNRSMKPSDAVSESASKQSRNSIAKSVALSLRLMMLMTLQTSSLQRHSR